MKIRTIIFGSIFVCILMILPPNIYAIELRTITDDITVYNENELFNAIKERIEKLKTQKLNPKMFLAQNDSDGPFEGGLDDLYDWLDLYSGIFYGYIVLLFIKNQALKVVFALRNMLVTSIWLVDYGLFTYYTLINFGDAFDIIDPDEDGY